MSIILVGLNHRTAPVDLRERLSLTYDKLYIALKERCIDDQSGSPGTGEPQTLESIPALLHEGVILSTCNRLEVYAVAADGVRGWQAIECFLARHHGIPPEL